MDVIEITRKLGAAIRQDERYINYAKAKLANDNDENLQKNIGEFNLIRMQLDNELSAEERNEDKIKELNEQLRMIYTQVMASDSMVAYNTANAGLDKMLNEINTLISMCVEGEDPETCDISSQCTGSCSTCGGCH